MCQPGAGSRPTALFLLDAALPSASLRVRLLPALTHLSPLDCRPLLLRVQRLSLADGQSWGSQGPELPGQSGGHSGPSSLAWKAWFPSLGALPWWGRGSRRSGLSRADALGGSLVPDVELGLGQASGTDVGWWGFLWAPDRVFRSAWSSFYLPREELLV